MKPNFVFYRLITFILLPIAGLNALSVLTALPAALSNPGMLFGLFVNFAVVAYTFTSFVFFIRGILNAKPQKPSLKDWIKVNAFVSVVFAGFVLLAAITYLSSTQVQKAVADNFQKLQQAMGAQSIDKATLLRALHWGLIFYGCYCALLIVHIVITLRLVKKYASVFLPGGNSGR